MATIFTVSIFICTFQASLSQRDVENIDCNADLSSFDTRWNRCKDEGCRGRCIKSCIDDGKDIHGTAIYTYDSPICKAALHDFRISSWNYSVRTVEFQYLFYTKSYVGSIRQNIKSKDSEKLKFSSNGSYLFKSPRITEEILDIISLHHNYIVKDGGKHTLECRVSSNAADRKVYFSKFPESKEYEGTPKRRGSQIYYTHSWNNLGGFWCKPERSMLSGVLSLAMSKHPPFLPTELTITKSIEDDAEIYIKPLSKIQPRYLLRKNEERISCNANRIFEYAETGIYIKFKSLNIGDAGIYSLDNDYGNLTNLGMTRLIVRVCKDGIYGSLCEHRCPNCLNGGVCHDITGDCICPPGFNGTLCENACKPGFFGRDCSQQCFNERNDTTNCAEILFCLPDPYGCSCISGFTSLFCNQTCDSGYYGSGCTQNCSHCKSSGACEAQTGKCLDGCEEGWHGTPCVLSYPAFKNAPTVESVTSNSMELSFEEWEESKDYGKGIPDRYIIQYKISKPESAVWKDMKEIKTNSSSGGNYIAVLSDLQINTMYSVRVIIKDVSGHARLSDVPTSQMKTLDGVPTENTLKVTKNIASLSKIIVPTKVTVRNKTFSKEGDETRFFDKTMEFDPPENPKIANLTEHSVDIKWSPQSKFMGNIFGYRINITVAESYNNSIIGTTQKNVVNSNTTSQKFPNLHSVTTYNVTIEVNTENGYGKPLWFNFTTEISEPVINYEPTVSNVTDTTIVVAIKPVYFEGPISAYFVMVEKEKRREKRIVSKDELRSFNESSERYVAAKLYPQEINSTGRSFTVGDGKHYNGYYNAPLNTGDKYKVGLAVLSEFKGKETIGYRYLTETVTVKKPDNITMVKTNLPGIIIGVIVFIIVIIFIIIYIKNRSKKKNIDERNSEKDGESVTFTTVCTEECEKLEGKNRKKSINELESFLQVA